MWRAWVPAASMNISPARWMVVPLPDEPKFSWPGLDFNKACSSLALFAGKAGLTFPTLDDSSQKLHRQYRVNSIPTIFVIDREGKIVRFLKGSRDEQSLRNVLQTVGF